MSSPHLFDVHPSLAMVQNVIAGMKQKTGRSLEEWIKLVKKEGPADEKARRLWHLIARHAAGGGAGDTRLSRA